MKYGNILFDGNRKGSVNIGDDLQLVAIENMYKKMNIEYDDVVRIPFSQLASYNGEYVILPISFPLYGYSHDRYITMFSDRIIPVFLGLSIMAENILPEEVEYLRRYEPIGCRDYYTYKVMKNHNIDAYVNGCMTITLDKSIFKKTTETFDKKVYITDLNEDYLKYVPEEILKNCEYRSQILESCDEPEEMAKTQIKEYYEKASLVITTRLHCAMPCVALGIPVIVLKDRYSFRFPTLSAYMHIYTKDDFSNINWKIEKINIELLTRRKELILNNAINRVKAQYNKYYYICEISELYEDEGINNGSFVEHIDNVIEFIANKYDIQQAFEYAVWGITQKADKICSYIENNYKRAKLKIVHDRDKKMIFHGVESSSDEKLLLDDNLFVFVTAATANSYAKDLFDRNKKEKNMYHISTDGVM